MISTGECRSDPGAVVGLRAGWAGDRQRGGQDPAGRSDGGAGGRAAAGHVPRDGDQRAQVPRQGRNLTENILT